MINKAISSIGVPVITDYGKFWKNNPRKNPRHDQEFTTLLSKHTIVSSKALVTAQGIALTPMTTAIARDRPEFYRPPRGNMRRPDYEVIANSMDGATFEYEKGDYTPRADFNVFSVTLPLYPNLLWTPFWYLTQACAGSGANRRTKSDDWLYRAGPRSTNHRSIKPRASLDRGSTMNHRLTSLRSATETVFVLQTDGVPRCSFLIDGASLMHLQGTRDWF